MFNENDPRSLEKYSSAITLSDMEVFIFPELMYSLFLANTMSPDLWAWLSDPWFTGESKKPPQRRIQRLKQYIIDHFWFNLDLDTWGLTTKGRELARFSGMIDESVLARSNALFGYEGDKYYFDIDIRKHFGLDKYNSDVIPYWKTETLEAMEAFRYKEGYSTGAGECVSLAALYAAASFVVAKIPLENIFMMATPLHSQNFLNIGDGIITNNRRIVTKTMWFNGTELSAKARRALENERVTIVAHRTGYIHVLYDKATIQPRSYNNFAHKLSKFLQTEVTYEILSNFLRQHSKYQRCFQISHQCCGKPRYIEAEKVYHYEHSSKSRVGNSTQKSLLHEIEEDEFYTEPLPERILMSEMELFFKENRVIFDETETVEKLRACLRHSCFNVDEIVHDLKKFCKTVPQLPNTDKEWIPEKPIDLGNPESAEEVIEKLESLRKENASADLAFYAFRDISRSAWKPFLKAALERNPVSLKGMSGMEVDQAYSALLSMRNDSIYSGKTRMAQPDEVWNFQRGDGLEKAICLINLIKNRSPEDRFQIEGEGKNIVVRSSGHEYKFTTSKELNLPSEKDFTF